MKCSFEISSWLGVRNQNGMIWLSYIDVMWDNIMWWHLNLLKRFFFSCWLIFYHTIIIWYDDDIMLYSIRLLAVILFFYFFFVYDVMWCNFYWRYEIKERKACDYRKGFNLHEGIDLSEMWLLEYSLRELFLALTFSF